MESTTIDLQMFDMAGRLVHSENTQNLTIGSHTYTIDISNLPKGIYLKRVIVGEAIQNVKLSVQ